MIKIKWGRSKSIHLLNKISFYYCNYLKHCEWEYWSGFNRKKVFQIGRLSVWVGGEK